METAKTVFIKAKQNVYVSALSKAILKDEEYEVDEKLLVNEFGESKKHYFTFLKELTPKEIVE